MSGGTCITESWTNKDVVDAELVLTGLGRTGKREEEVESFIY